MVCLVVPGGGQENQGIVVVELGIRLRVSGERLCFVRRGALVSRARDVVS